MTLTFVLGACVLVLSALLLASHLRVVRALAAIADGAQSKARLEEGRDAELKVGFRELHDAMAAFESRLQSRNMAQLNDAFSATLTDFRQRIVTQFQAQLEALATSAKESTELHRKQRSEQTEMMHHARRIAATMEKACVEFAALIEAGSALAAISADVRQAAALLGPCQQAIDNSLLHQANAVQAQLQAMTDLRAAFGDTADQLLTQTRRSLESLAQRSSQANMALSKDLGETLAKATSSISKQLTVMSPMAQQVKRIIEPARTTR